AAVAPARRYMSTTFAHSETIAAAPSLRTVKNVAFTVLGSTAVVAGVSHMLKDEVVYWTPNARK
ncbi:hypothetical protein BG004_006600, partial [Podila humilis]